MAFLNEVGKAIGKASQGISDAAQTIGEAAKETRENIARERQEKEVEKENKKIVAHEKAAEEARKCPHCGEPLKAFQTVCPACGQEIVNVKSSSAVTEFTRVLKEIEAGRKPETKLGKIAQSVGVAKKDNTDERIMNHIRSFNVPNNKEDVFEFIIMAASNVNMSVVSARNPMDAGVSTLEQLNTLKAINEAWISKLNQVYEKAKLAFGTDSDFYKIKDVYERTFESISNAKKAKNTKFLLLMLPVVALVAICFIYFGRLGTEHKQLEKKLETTVQEIQVDIQNGNYDDALIKAQSLHMDDNYSSESKAHWDEQREALIKLIEEKKGSEE